jgi:hypothetical protein
MSSVRDLFLACAGGNGDLEKCLHADRLYIV